MVVEKDPTRRRSALNGTDSIGSVLNQSGKLELLESKKELEYGKSIFEAKAALRNLRILTELPIITQEQRSKIEGFLSDERNSNLLSELDNEMNKFKGSNDPHKKALLEDVNGKERSFYQTLQDIYSLEDSGNENRLQPSISALIDQQTELANKGREADMRLILHNFGLVKSIAKKHEGRGLSFQDLVSEGIIGLMKASLRFDHRRKNKFSTYATWWIKQTMKTAIAQIGSPIRIPRHDYEEIGSLSKKRAIKEEEEGRGISLEEFIEEHEINPKKRNFMIGLVRQLHIKSLDEPVNNGESIYTLGDFLVHPEEGPEDRIDKASKIKQLQQALTTLDPQERTILELRFGLVDGISRTLQEIADEIEKSKEGVRIIEKKAIKKLKLTIPPDEISDN